MPIDCGSRALVDAHFLGRIAPPEEHALRVHLASCEPCRLHYRRRLLLAKLDPAALPPEERIRRGLWPERRIAARAVAVVAALAIAALVFLVARPKQAAPGARDDGFASRGELARGDRRDARIVVYRVAKNGAGGPVRLEGGDVAIRPEDELAFAYRNGAGKGYLMIFGVDERQHVYWFHPAWTDASADPAAVAIARDGATHELREAIRHPLQGSRLELHGLFLDEPRTVRDVESEIAVNAGKLPAMEGRVDDVTTLAVAR